MCTGAGSGGGMIIDFSINFRHPLSRPLSFSPQSLSARFHVKVALQRRKSRFWCWCRGDDEKKKNYVRTNSRKHSLKFFLSLLALFHTLGFIFSLSLALNNNFNRARISSCCRPSNGRGTRRCLLYYYSDKFFGKIIFANFIIRANLGIFIANEK